MFHHQQAGGAALLAPLFGDDEHHREPAGGCAPPHPAVDSMARREDGVTLGGVFVPRDTEKSFRKIKGYRDLWMLKAILNPQPGWQQEAA